MRFKAALSGLVFAGIMASGSVQASLIDRGGGLIYDTVLDISWLKDANNAKTSGYDADGKMNWSAANSWAANLTYAGYNDWRLPTALNYDGSAPCYLYYCSGSEMGHLFYVDLGVHAFASILSSVDADLTKFSNVQSYFYWTGFQSVRDQGYAWLFANQSGGQGVNNENFEFYAWAVRDGDVASVATIPEPGTLALLGLALTGLAVSKKRQRRA